MTSLDELVRRLRMYNVAYRRGAPLVSDHEYDSLVAELKSLAPDHPFLSAVEPEVFDTKLEVRHPTPMLSIEKAYTREELERFLSRVAKEAADIGASGVLFQVTPKLDGLAGRDDGTVFASRGNGEVGYEISSAFQKGVIPVGGRGQGIGEIVIVKSYFDEHLADKFEHPRNMVVGIVASDTLNEFARQTLSDGAVHFVPYVGLPSWTGTAEQLLADLEAVTMELAARTDYPMDGMVVMALDERVRARMGATTHHYRWQIALKTKGETAETVVENVLWQVGRTGNVTPVMEVRPVSLSGATIRRVTAHHAGRIRDDRIGPGASIEIIRSGEVIPKLEKVITPSSRVEIPDRCPSCGLPLQWENDFLRCDHASCPAQIEQGISHFFKTLGTADWFGIKTIRKLVAGGYDSLEKVYALAEKDFAAMGFGPVQSRNLHDALRTSLAKPVEDWRFLAAFGISNLGKGDSRKLLSHFAIEELPALDAAKIAGIHGFGEITSRAVAAGLDKVRDTLAHMLALGFTILRTPPAGNGGGSGMLSGKSIVFSGKMRHGDREEMQAQARRLGAQVQTAVGGRTDYLVCGEKVGQAKLDKAKKLGVAILTEEEYFQMLRERSPE
ncbi:MAG: BRCT domain-containing protein [Thermodesulfobacteriota bacterium]